MTSTDLPTRARFELPAWVFEGLELDAVTRPEQRMRVCIELADRSRRHGGGPFGALVFDRSERRVVSVSVNLVVPAGSSLFHAEIGALWLAQTRAGRYALDRDCELVTSSEPCAQCLGAVCWSGVGRLVCGAPAADAESIGFDEGPRREDWIEQLEARGVRVTRGLLAAEAKAVLRAYAAQGGPIYNGTG